MAYLTLSDGTVYEGISFGYEGDGIGEVVFNTGMTGYQELLTDPSYVGQIVNMTYPLIGNYGVNSSDVESARPHVRGFIVRDYCEAPSNWKCEETLQDYLKQNKIVAIHSIDTRALTRKIRNYGAMAGIITQNMPTPEDILKLKTFKIETAVKEVSTPEVYRIEGTNGMRIAVMDYGLKRNILGSLSRYGYTLTVFPAETPYQEVLKEKPDGIMLTNGPGDPSENTVAIENLTHLIGQKPMFGICLGHQLLALAHGGKTVKMKYGHRGSNHPVKDLATGRVYITSQNHGYVVDGESLGHAGEISHLNWNDRTVEGIRYREGCVFSVQFHPEAKPGTNDTGYLFDVFHQTILENR